MGVIIGMDPHKRSATIEVVDESGRRLAVGRFGMDRAGYVELLAAGREHPDRVWAVEGCNWIGRHIAHRLVHDGESVVDVPPKLSAHVRVLATGNGRKTDPVNAHSVALAAVYAAADPGLVQVVVDDDLVVMGMLVDRRDELGGRGHKPSTGCIGFCWNCSQEGRSSSCPRRRPAASSRRPSREISSARPGAGLRSS